ncbi:uncharacterized protein LOC121411333 [Lytechinus variegatus]|uniref:uncharacterized protein LOC121411333 n=1 Tax=Lytechinus variegatus TaxID=7654 RepID=UPI001BB1E44E|nr:uncharacterized protein LOC121411333 [Lytechinus variegatus]
MLFHKVAIGLCSLIIVHPALKLFGITWDKETVDIDVITATEDEEMSTNVYHNGVLFGVWVAGVAISMGRLLSAIFGGSGKNGIDAETQTDHKTEEKELGQEPEEDELNIVTGREELDKVTEIEAKGIKVINQESYIKLKGVKQENEDDDDPLRSPPNDDVTTPVEVVSKEGKGEGSNIGDPKLDEKEDNVVKSATKISVYKLPAIKRHSFMILQDGMNSLKQAVSGRFSLEKISLDGVRNFIFIVAKGTPSQLSELESKVKADFRWLTPVREPSPALTGAPATQEQKWVSSTSPKARDMSRIPTSPRTRSQTLRLGLSNKTPNPKFLTNSQK